MTNSQRILDIGCGSGLLSIPLSKYAGEMVAVDKDQEMIEVARSETAKAGINNITYRWMAGEKISASLGKFDLAVFGNSFHWMDRKLVGKKLRSVLNKTGSVAILTAFYIWHGDEPWKKIVRETITEYTGEDRSSGLNVPSSEVSDRDILQEAKFVNIQTKNFVSQQQYTLQALMGFLASTSYASHKKLGNKADDFERELAVRLTSFDNSGLYTETVEYKLVTARQGTDK
jgi:ubiquinone/menaquinone biosynthesis C-methylase UbiE